MRASCTALAMSFALGLGMLATAQAAGPELVQEKVDPEVAKADLLFRAGVKAVKAEKWDRALALFERALPKKAYSSDLYFNLVQTTKALRMWDRLVLYAQGFLFLEPGTRDSLTIRDELDAALATLAERGKGAVTYRFDVKPLLTPVYVDRVPVASSAAVDIRLAPGKYTLSASKEDWYPWTEALVVPVPSGPQVDPIVVKGALQPVPAVGKLLIVTTPAEGVQVFQDDVLVGTTPLPGPIELATARRYLFRFEKPGYDRWHRYIEVYKGETLELRPIMEELPTTSRVD